jgi:hypothetical protein
VQRAPGIPRSPLGVAPRPLSGESIPCNNSGASCRGNAKVCFIRVIARSEATKQSILSSARWIASRSLSSGAHSRDPLARNDGSLFVIVRLDRTIQYSRAPVMESKGCGVLDTPLSRSMTAYYGAVRRIHFADASVLPLSADEPSTKGRIGKRQFRAAPSALNNCTRSSATLARAPGRKVS